MKHDPASGVAVRAWLTGPPPPEVRKAIDRIARADDVRRIAIMPDVHLASGVCVGSVVATSRLVYPQAVGSDIGCGMSAIAFSCGAESIDNPRVAPAILASLRERVPILRHRSLAGSQTLPASLGDLSERSLQAAAAREGRIELGTLGRGNHFLEFQQDSDGRLWLMVHSGSRVMGQEITKFHTSRATKHAGGLVALDSSQATGEAYLNDVAWAIRYAAASRAAMIERAADIIRGIFVVEPDRSTFMDASHNHARRESYPQGDLLIHRKGASPAAADEPGMIPGSMGAPSFHVLGRGIDEALRSSSHGAGRVMSRGKAGGQISTRRLEQELGSLWLDLTRLHALADEAPSAYKDIRAVMRAQRDLVRIVRELKPILSYKGA
jgi:tRNA-splicing ligase RtcB